MTGKFTENVHGMGRAAGRTLHNLVRAADGASARLPSGLGAITRAADIRSLPSSIPPLLSASLDAVLAMPGRYRAWWLDLLRSDPLHVLVETLLIFMCVSLVLYQRRVDWRFTEERKRGAPTEEEEEELLREWKEERRRPLGGGRDRALGGSRSRKLGEVGTGAVVERIEGSRLYLLSDLEPSDVQPSPTGDGERGKARTTPVVNFATFDYLASSSSPVLRSVARSALSAYGCGSCGPRGFYGTIDAHLEVEAAMAEFINTEGAVLYSDGASAATSTVAAFAKRGDLLVVDEGVSEPLLVGVTLSRSNVRYFRHNDARDLRRVLERVAAQDKALGRRPTDQRRFLVVEGVYRNWGTIAPLREIVKLKEEFCYRLILDDSHAMGVLGETGRGSLEHHGLRPMAHAEILTFGLENSFGSVGGMTVGSEEVVDHQRLSGAGYCFSASAPPFLSKVCLANVRRMQGRWDEVTEQLKGANDNGSAGEKNNGRDGPEAQDPPVSEDDAEIDLVDADRTEELSGPPLLDQMRRNVSVLYGTLTDASHPHALKLRNRLSITSHPLSPITYLRLADEEAVGRTRSEQTAALDEIARRCLAEGVAIVSTGAHVVTYLQLVPEPCLRLVANAAQTREDVEALVKALGEAVEVVLVFNEDGNFVMD